DLGAVAHCQPAPCPRLLAARAAGRLDPDVHAGVFPLEPALALYVRVPVAHVAVCVRLRSTRAGLAGAAPATAFRSENAARCSLARGSRTDRQSSRCE